MNGSDVDVMAIFCEVLDRTSPGERTAYLAEVCGDNLKQFVPYDKIHPCTLVRNLVSASSNS